MAIQAMDDVRREELHTEPEEVAAALLGAAPGTRRHLLWSMRKNPAAWTAAQTDAMHWLQRSALKSARAWRLRMALREVYARARQHNSAEQAAGDLAAWASRARRCRLEPFKKLAATIKARFDAVVRGMLDHRSNAFVESMNGQFQQANRAGRGYRTAKNFIAIAYLRLSRLKNLPAHPFSATAAAR
jgi:transposase